MKAKLFAALMLSVGVACVGLSSCNDDDLTVRKADYDPNYKGTTAFEEADYVLPCDQAELTIPFSCDVNWTARVYDPAATDAQIDWATVTPEAGQPGDTLHVTITFQPNQSNDTPRTLCLEILTEKGSSETLEIVQDLKPLVPAEIADYDKYICPGTWNPHFEKGPEAMLRGDSYYSWTRMKQSEHFFCFWSPEFGADPNSEDVKASMRVDIDDLLAKAEKFFDTNVNHLKMCTLGQGTSTLDMYKMQIYLLYQDEWLATGSGYDNVIGALWVNPSTCQPVGSVIAHEIGHSFQYMVYADKVHQGLAPKDAELLPYGFRYGYGTDGAGGNAYWEMCAQWQSFQDYPHEQFASDFNTWRLTPHYHFLHPWHRYASYWLQTYWTNKHGIEAYGKIWQDSEYPEDPVEAYTRLYNGGNWQTTREEIADYAVHMATYDIPGIREYCGPENYDSYDQTMWYDDATGEYQISYQSCPQATGFNVIALTVPDGGGQVSVDFRGLSVGAPLAKKDKGVVLNGDQQSTSQKVKNYNTLGEDSNLGWRYGFVALSGDHRSYSDIAAAKNGTLTFNCPANADYLFLVVNGSPEQYVRCWWNTTEAANATENMQYPYAIKLHGTDLAHYSEPVEPEYNVIDANNMEVSVEMKGKPDEYLVGEYDIANPQIAGFFGLDESQIGALKLDAGADLQDGRIAVLAVNADGSYNYTANANGGYWLGANGDSGAWGDPGYGYFEFGDAANTVMSIGNMPGKPDYVAGFSCPIRCALIYVNGATQKRVLVKVTLHY